jgi:tRNA (cytidine/uridine-2'-O-)-methyltransferase
VKVVLFQPQIPQNTGNVVRTCSVTGCGLVLVTPLGFSVTNRWLKRAGLDYWEGVEVELIDDLPLYLESHQGHFYFFSSKVKDKKYSEIYYKNDDLLIFGSETSGLPSSFFQRWPDHFATLPMIPSARCLNLATTAGIVVYEAWKQRDFS